MSELSAASPHSRPLTRVGVVGSGTMGGGIAELCARRGLDVRLAVSRESSLVEAPRRIKASFDRQVAKGRMTEDESDAALGRISVTMNLGSFADREVVFEAVVEDELAKREVFASLDKVLPSDAILGTTTSALSITRLASGTAHPERVVGTHFFNPVSSMRLIEIVPTLLTDGRHCHTVERFAEEVLGKTSVRTADRSGFVVNALLIPYLLDAVRLVEQGTATAEQVDQAMELGCGHPMGPLRLADLIGLDVVAAIADALHREFKQPQYASPAPLSRLVEIGWHGRKSGRGFYQYA
ncbi:3-hydroxybutyryl-CoA dehydrogenase [Streptomyces sp. NPDC088354]|uniref:3-hydroxybutyryl-CoA dehydrogenase n=1 Tax=Streptomyces sp. NPDC088354 TaxID=3365856 RepID=UPI003801214E